MSLIPSTAECNEGSQVSLSVNIILEPQYVMKEILSITGSIVSEYSTIQYIINGNSGFFISGTYVDVFDRTLKYIKSDKSHAISKRWSEIPEDFYALYSFTPPSSEFIDNIITVTYDVYETIEIPGQTLAPNDPPASPTYQIDYNKIKTLSEQFIHTIRRNWATDITTLKQIANSGSLNKNKESSNE